MAYFPPTGSVVTFQSQPSSMLVGASIIGAVPVTGNVFVAGSIAAVGSITALQGTNPWIVNMPSSSVISYQAAGSVLAVSGSFSGGNSSVTAFQGGAWSASVSGGYVNVIGSVATVPPSGVYITSVVNTTPSSMLVGASIIGLTPVSPTPSSVFNYQAGTTITSISGTITIGAITSGASIVGTYQEDLGHTSGDRGLFTLGVRNDAVASFASADLDYTPHALDSAGRGIVKLYAPEESRVEGYNSVVSGSVTTLVAAAGTGLKNYITDIMIANTGSVATLVTFKDGAASILGYTIAPAGGGSNIVGMAIPMRTGANATFDFQAATSSSVLYATVKGYKAP